MQRFGIGRSAALQLVREKREVVNPNRGFYRQLKVWKECEYDVYSKIRIDGVRQLKEEYLKWKRENGERKQDGRDEVSSLDLESRLDED